MVTWIWLGALLTFAGGLVALWPARGGGPDRGTARAKARVAKDLRPEPPRDAEPEDAPRPDLQPA
jgi:hypothetical protein